VRLRLFDDTCYDRVVPVDLQWNLIRQLRCRGGPQSAADGNRGLNQASRVCVIFFKELGGSAMMPRGLIGMSRCETVVFQACSRCGHVSSELAMLLEHPAQRGILVHQTSTLTGSETTQPSNPNSSHPSDTNRFRGPTDGGNRHFDNAGRPP
jgi:hypothetical protein